MSKKKADEQPCTLAGPSPAAAPLIDNRRIPKPLVLSRGEPCSITVNVSGAPTPTVRWQIGRKRVKESAKYQLKTEGRLGHTLVIARATDELDQGVWVVASNEHGEDVCQVEVKTCDPSHVNGTTTTVSNSSSSAALRKKGIGGGRAKRSRRLVGECQSVSSLDTWATDSSARGRVSSIDDVTTDSGSTTLIDLNQSCESEVIQAIQRRRRSNTKSRHSRFSSSTDAIYNRPSQSLQDSYTSIATVDVLTTAEAKPPKRRVASAINSQLENTIVSTNIDAVEENKKKSVRKKTASDSQTGLFADQIKHDLPAGNESEQVLNNLENGAEHTDDQNSTIVQNDIESNSVVEKKKRSIKKKTKLISSGSLSGIADCAKEENPEERNNQQFLSDSENGLQDQNKTDFDGVMETRKKSVKKKTASNSRIADTTNECPEKETKQQPLSNFEIEKLLRTEEQDVLQVQNETESNAAVQTKKKYVRKKPTSSLCSTALSRIANETKEGPEKESAQLSSNLENDSEEQERSEVVQTKNEIQISESVEKKKKRIQKKDLESLSDSVSCDDKGQQNSLMQEQEKTSNTLENVGGQTVEAVSYEQILSIPPFPTILHENINGKRLFELFGKKLDELCKQLLVDLDSCNIEEFRKEKENTDKDVENVRQQEEEEQRQENSQANRHNKQTSKTLKNEDNGSCSDEETENTDESDESTSKPEEQIRKKSLGNNSQTQSRMDQASHREIAIDENQPTVKDDKIFTEEAPVSKDEDKEKQVILLWKKLYVKWKNVNVTETWDIVQSSIVGLSETFSSRIKGQRLLLQ